MVLGAERKRRGVRAWQEEERCKELAGGRTLRKAASRNEDGIISWQEEGWFKMLAGGRMV